MSKYTYQIQPFQQRILQEVKSLNTNNLYYYVIEQDYTKPPLTLPELKKCVSMSIRKYIKDLLGFRYKKGKENELIKYYCFFETSKEFCISQTTQSIFDWDFYNGFHFHLFISSSFSEISFQNYTHYLFEALTSIPTKKNSLLKFDYTKIFKLDDDFILYHSKQWQNRYEVELTLNNVSKM
jgi:hypothetical protein